MNVDVAAVTSSTTSTRPAPPIALRGRIAPVRTGKRWTKLRLVLVGCDALAIALALMVAVHFSSYGRRHHLGVEVLTIAGGVVLGLWAVRSQGLFLARVSAVRGVELQRIARAAALTAALGLVIDRLLHLDMSITLLGGGAVLVAIALLCHRSIYRAWLAAARQAGRYRRDVVVVGTGPEARRLVRLFDTHRELGIHVVGVVGDPHDAQEEGLAELWRGDVDATDHVVLRQQVSGVVLSPSDVEPDDANRIIRSMQRAGVHVHLGTGVAGVDMRRMRALPLAHEPLLYVEAPTLSLAQVVAKRVFDVVVSAVMIVLTAPLMLAVAIAMKITDPGPTFFKQRRVGRNGAEFEVIKFRSMVVDAEARLAALKAANERDGELFKMTHDPRVTRIGKFLRDSSLDELPQLFNVLKGEMSLVGPRPALPSEVANFSPTLRSREVVRPGITGLWQVEARDNPSFEAYARLDLFYVENWSMALDFTIILGTVEQVLARTLSSLTARHG